MRRLSLAFKSKDSKMTALIAANKPTETEMDKKERETKLTINIARDPSNDLSGLCLNLCFPNLFPTTAAAGSPNDKIKAEPIANLRGKKRITSNIPAVYEKLAT